MGLLLQKESVLDSLRFDGLFALMGFVFVLTTATLAFLAQGIYNVWFHPLKKYPGPRWWAFSRLPWHITTIGTSGNYRIQELHKKYGPVVRVGPNDLSYISSTAWKTIYGHRSQPMEKTIVGGGFPKFIHNGPDNILTAPRAMHAQQRRLVAHAFSDKALREQEDLINRHITLMLSQLYKKSPEGPLDMCKWFNFTTFDIIGDLAFGKSFHCLDGNQYHSYVKGIMSGVKAMPYIHLLENYGLRFTENWFVPKSLMQQRRANFKYAKDTVENRLANDVKSKDFFSYILNAPEEKLMDREQMTLNAQLFIAAGSETTATLVSACTFAILTHPEIYKKAVSEIRGRFKEESEITVQACAELKYLLAVLEESLRWFPPVPATMPRRVPKGGEVIDGEFVPEGTVVGVNQLSASRSERNWHRPEEFLPERFLPEGKEPSSPFFSDDRQSMQPFSFGPRNCLGRNLAYAEMKLIMARLLFNFDLEVTQHTKNTWLQENGHGLLWFKAPLMCNLTPVRQVVEVAN